MKGMNWKGIIINWINKNGWVFVGKWGIDSGKKCNVCGWIFEQFTEEKRTRTTSYKVQKSSCFDTSTDCAVNQCFWT